MSATRNGTKDGLNKYIVDLLECPVCMETCAPPIKSCIKGHSICNVCESQIRECPICREKYVGTRNFMAEELFEKLQKEKTENTENANGNSNQTQTDVNLNVEEEDEEEEDPIINENISMTCVLAHTNDCHVFRKSVPFPSYTDHLEKYHKVISGQGPKFTIQMPVHRSCLIKNDAKQLFTLKWKKRTFVIQCHQEKQKIWIWVSLHGSEAHQKNFEAKLSIHKKNKDFLKLDWAGKVNLTTDKREVIINTPGNCLATSESTIQRQYVETNESKVKVWHLTVELTRLEKPSLDTSTLRPRGPPPVISPRRRSLNPPANRIAGTSPSRGGNLTPDNYHSLVVPVDIQDDYSPSAPFIDYTTEDVAGNESPANYTYY